MKAIKNYFTYWAYLTYYFLQIQYGRIKQCFKNDKNVAYMYDVMLFALIEHHKVRQRYDKRFPYFYHLNMVLKFGLKFKSCVNDNVSVLLGCLLHDVVEDIHSFTHADLKKLYGNEVAEIVFACTELRGRTRDERHGPEYYEGLQENELGAFVKICDVMANMTMGVKTGSGMLAKYRKDYPKFKQLLYKDKFKAMFDYIESNLLTDK